MENLSQSASINAEYISKFFKWFINRYENQAYRQMGVEDIKDWSGGDAHKDLVMVINRNRGVIEIESNYFADGHAEFSLPEIGARYELYRKAR